MAVSWQKQMQGKVEWRWAADNWRKGIKDGEESATTQKERRNKNEEKRWQFFFFIYIYI